MTGRLAAAALGAATKARQSCTEAGAVNRKGPAAAKPLAAAPSPSAEGMSGQAATAEHYTLKLGRSQSGSQDLAELQDTDVTGHEQATVTEGSQPQQAGTLPGVGLHSDGHASSLAGSAADATAPSAGMQL